MALVDGEGEASIRCRAPIRPAFREGVLNLKELD